MIKTILNYFPFLKGLFPKIFRREIPFDIHERELMIRCIGHPFFYSINDNRIKREAFLPKPDENEVSIIRHDYTNSNYCKCYCMELQFQNFQYCGIATFNAAVISSMGNCYGILILATPLNEKKEYIKYRPVYTNTLGVPMHAGIVFPNKIVKGTPCTEYRKFASLMAKSVKYYGDPNPKLKKWEGDLLEF